MSQKWTISSIQGVQLIYWVWTPPEKGKISIITSQEGPGQLSLPWSMYRKQDKITKACENFFWTDTFFRGNGITQLKEEQRCTKREQICVPISSTDWELSTQAINIKTNARNSVRDWNFGEVCHYSQILITWGAKSIKPKGAKLTIFFLLLYTTRG